MKNLSKKIGVGVVASSLVVGGAVSTGLVANAESVTGSQVEQSNRESKLDKIGDLELVGAAKEMYQFRVFGYYLTSYDKNHRMKDDITEALEGFDRTEKEKIEEIVKGEVPKELQFGYGKDFLIYLSSKGMDKGIKKVVIGDAEVILVFTEKISPNTDWDEKIIDKWIAKNLNVNVDDIEERDHLHGLKDIF